MSFTGGAAYPQPTADMNEWHTGMTLRDYFAAAAPVVPEWFSRMHLYGADPNGTGTVNKDITPATLAQQRAAFIAWRWHYADAMLTERVKA